MRFNPIAPFLDARRRPRAIITLGVGAIFMVILMVAGLVGTSFEWFCTTPCHTVHDDNTVAYKASSHKNVSCIACHEPVNASPLTFVMMKIHVLPDLPATIFGYYEAPNLANHVATEMPSEQCTQCHNLDNRTVTTSLGLVMDHDVHEQNGVTCTTCHNRVAHNDDAITKFAVRDNRAHDNWMKMDACFRCHSLEQDAKAPGECAKCHEPGFDLEPKSHDAKNWYAKFGDSAGHAKAARAEAESVAKAHELNSEFEPLDAEHAEGPVLMPASEVNSCTTCHKQDFCDSCHKLDMPHPAEFKTDHGKQGYASPQTCAQCHARSAAEAQGTQFCSACHHPTSTPGQPWLNTHKSTVSKSGAEQCFKCHKPEACSSCHVDMSMRGLR